MEQRQFFTPPGAQGADTMADRASTTAYFAPSRDMTDTPADFEDLLPAGPQTLQPTRGYNDTFVHDMPRIDQRQALNGQAALCLNHSGQHTAAEADILFSLASNPATARSPHPTLPIHPRPLAGMPPQPQQSSLERLAPVNVPSFSTNHPPVDPEATAADGTALESDLPNAGLGDLQIFTALQRNGRTLAHAVAAITGESPAGNMMSSFTVAELVTAVKFGRAYITLEGPVSTSLEELAREMGYSVDDLTQDNATAAARGSALQTYSINLHEGMFIHLVLPDIPDVPFERKRGGGCWLPPVEPRQEARF